MRAAEAFVIRVATAADDVALGRLDSAAFSAGGAFPSSVVAPGEPFFSQRNPPEVHLVADAGGDVLGYVRVQQQIEELPENVHVLAIHGLAVAPAAQRRGVATALMLGAESMARDRGARKLSLRMFADNDSARALYERLGYVVEGVLREEFLINGEYVDDVLMTKWLNR